MFSLAGDGVAGEMLALNISPEVWYTKWTPDFKSPEQNVDINYSKYKVRPTFLSGMSASASYGHFGIIGTYLSSQLEKEVSGKSGARMVGQIRGEIAGRLSERWYIKNRIVRGKFKGNAYGTEWDYASGTSVKALPVDTSWFQGDLGVILASGKIAEDIVKYAGAGVFIGYRYQEYTLPTQIKIYDVEGQSGASFLNTRFRMHHILFGVEALPSKETGWRVDVQRVILGIGMASADNSKMHETTSWAVGGSDKSDKADYSMSLEADIGAMYTSPFLVFELGARYYSIGNKLGKGGKTAAIGVTPGNRIEMNDYYLGPYVRVGMRFNI